MAQDVSWRGEAPLAAVAAAMVDLPPDEVDQLHLLVEAEICRCGSSEVNSLYCHVSLSDHPSLPFPSLCVPQFLHSDITKNFGTSFLLVTTTLEAFVTPCFVFFYCF